MEKNSSTLYEDLIDAVRDKYYQFPGSNTVHQIRGFSSGANGFFDTTVYSLDGEIKGLGKIQLPFLSQYFHVSESELPWEDFAQNLISQSFNKRKKLLDKMRSDEIADAALNVEDDDRDLICPEIKL